MCVLCGLHLCDGWQEEAAVPPATGRGAGEEGRPSKPHDDCKAQGEGEVKSS